MSRGMFLGFLEGICSIWRFLDSKSKLAGFCQSLSDLILYSKLVHDYLDRILPPKWPKLIHALARNPGSTDEQLAMIANLDLNLVRRMLYALYNSRIAYFEREMREEDGWIIYHWRSSLSNLDQLILNDSRRMMENLKRKLEFEQSTMFYECSKEDKRFVFDVAMELNFRCPDCNSELKYYDNSKLIRAIQSKLDQLGSMG